jgi:glycosyltransferase involved in cell wall biosynthesis
MKILVKGPVLTRTGYGEHCRFVMRALRTLENVDLYLIPGNWGRSNWIWEDDEERRWLDSIIQKTAQYHRHPDAKYDISIQVTIPNEWQRMAPVNIGVTAGIETTLVAPVWLEKANMMDQVITISEHSRNIFAQTGYDGTDSKTGQRVNLRVVDPDNKLKIVHYPVKNFEPTSLNLNFSTKFNFLTVAQWGPRKNVKNTVRWFVEEFYDNPDVGLVVKTFFKGGSLMDREKVKRKIKKVLRKYKDMQCKVYVLHGDMTDQEMHSLYGHQDINCLVSLTHGEGFGLPLFEAAYTGLPVLATNWSGHLDFLNMPIKDKKNKKKLRSCFAKVDFDIKQVPESAVWNGVIQKESGWAYPQQGSYKMKLRQVYKDHGRFESQAKKLQKWVLENFAEEKQYTKFNDCIKEFFVEAISDEELDDLFSQM